MISWGAQAGLLGAGMESRQALQAQGAGAGTHACGRPACSNARAHSRPSAAPMLPARAPTCCPAHPGVVLLLAGTMMLSQRIASGPRAAGMAASTSRRTLSVRAQAGADDKFAGYKPTVAAFFPGQGAQTVGMAKVRREGAGTGGERAWWAVG